MVLDLTTLRETTLNLPQIGTISLAGLLVLGGALFLLLRSRRRKKQVTLSF